MLGISLTAIVLLHTDKLILSRIVSLEEFGIYAVGQALAASLNAIVLPVFNATYPRLCELIARSDEAGIQAFYRSVCQLMSALVIPVMSMLIFFSESILGAWTGNPELAREAAPVLTLLAAGTALNALMYPAYGLQLARGNTHIALRTNLMLCLVVIPGTVLLASKFGAIGAASVWPIANAIYLAIGIPWTYKACLRSRAWPTFYRDLACQQGPTFAFAGAAYAWLPLASQRLSLILELLLLSGAIMAVSLACSPVVRDGWRHWVRRSAIVSP
jgi:O-antigen/teichoic acid export membrane protein